MDDANIPSLLAMPYIGYCKKNAERYLNTREVILSEWNPYYYSGSALQGIGSPHTPHSYVWMIALCVQGLTSESREEKEKILEMVCNADAGTDLMHESVCKDDPGAVYKAMVFLGKFCIL